MQGRSVIQEFDLESSRLSDRIYVKGGTFTSLKINNTKTDDILIQGLRWEGDSELRIEQSIDTGIFSLLGPTMNAPLDPPRRFILDNFVFSTAIWGDAPLAVFAIMPTYNPSLYNAVAKSYSDAGKITQANDLILARQKQDFWHAQGIDQPIAAFKVPVYWLGIHPGYGVLLIAGLVLIGGMIFAGAQPAKGPKPSNPLVFALDSVIPVIHLDKDHDGVGYEGWRQYFLYFLRFLGAALILLLLELLRRTVLGAD
ncbi:MAG: hypothetical protein JOY83_25760 [Alphaproteobacteria bacterium]|nr:hypothetical protein [Alphaproteobacteria bacterium]